MTIEWREPPTAGGPKGSALLAQFVKELRTRPGEWAVFPRTYSSSGQASHFKLRYPDCEFTGRKVEQGTFEVYGRYIGDAK